MLLANFDEVVAALSRGDAVRLNVHQVRAVLDQFPNAARFLLPDVRMLKLDLAPRRPTKEVNRVLKTASLTDVKGTQSAQIFHGLLARLDSSSHRQSAVAELLRQRADEKRKNLKDDEFADLHSKAMLLDSCVKNWLERRLWSINLAPELVAHDERHVAAVESLLASLIEPYWLERTNYNCRFSADELVWLSVAAWLHDWGHVGGAISPYRLGADHVFVSHTIDVRKLHGLISQCLMSPDREGLHGLKQAVAAPAAILCAHHQGWTSFDDSAPDTPEAMERLRLGRPPSLRDNWNALPDSLRPPSLTFERLRFLVALLRVADGADLGTHRVADRGEARSAFLDRCLYREALRTMEQAQLSKATEKERAYVMNTARELAVAALSSRLSQFQVETGGSHLLEQLNEYRKFLIEQFGYYDKHATVRTVHFEYRQSRFDAIVCPTDEDRGTSEALQAVAEDIDSELVKSDVQWVLASNGFMFRRVCTPSWFRNPTSKPIAGASQNRP